MSSSQIFRKVYLISSCNEPLVAFADETKAKEELEFRKEKFKEFEFKIETLVMYDKIELLERCINENKELNIDNLKGDSNGENNNYKK